MKILNGVYTADSGEIWIDGQKVTLRGAQDAQHNGISIIYQDFNLVPTLSVAENIFIGRLSKKNSPWVNWKELNKKAEELLSRLHYNLDPKQTVEEFSVAQMQMIEISKAISYNAKIIIMDEPSAVLTENELKKLFEIVRDLKQQGITIIYISHRLEEIFQICDQVTILRDGKVIETKPIHEITRVRIIEAMVGRKLDQEFPKRANEPGEVMLTVTGMNRGKKVKNVSFDLRRGEILGLAGLVGAGRTETVRLVFGADKCDSGSVSVNGEWKKIHSPWDAKRCGLALLPEDRKGQGLLLDMSVARNITFTNLDKIKVRFRILNPKQEKAVAMGYIESLRIKAPSTTQPVQFLSGGNQQKVAIAKWLFSDADILILDEPTRGIDVGAKYEIYLLMNELVKQGKSIILVSSELNEIVAMSDRVVVMHEGELKAILQKEEISAERVLMSAIG